MILVNVIVFAALSVSPDLADLLLLNPSTLAEKPWSILTVFFSHELAIHLLLNALLLYVFGTRLEKETNPGVTLGVYILCGLAGSVSAILYSAAIGYQGEPMAGASASAFGIAAAYAALRPDAVVLKSKAVHWVAALFAVNALLTAQNPQISVGGPAHAVGLALGLLFGYALRRKSAAKE